MKLFVNGQEYDSAREALSIKIEINLWELEKEQVIVEDTRNYKDRCNLTFIEAKKLGKPDPPADKILLGKEQYE